MATGEKNAAALGVDRLAGNIAPALHLRGGGGVASVGRYQGKGQRQQRNHTCKRGGVLFLHAAMVQGGHEEWLKEREGQAQLLLKNDQNGPVRSYIKR